MKIMLVDDEKLLRNGFKYMTDWKFKGIEIISEAINGQDALEKLKTVEPDVVLTDINMPIMNGIELTKQIKLLYPHIIVVILSGYDNYEYIRESMKYGASDYLLKATVDVDEIYEMLHALKVAEKNNTIANSSNQSESQENILLFDEEKIINFIELQQFDDLKTYVRYILSEKCNCNLSQIKDSLRDLFFFIQFHLDRLNLLSKYLKKRKYINSSSVDLITDVSTAIDWIELILDAIARDSITASSQHVNKVKKVIDIIHDQYTQPGLSLSFIADILFINKNHLCDLFKAETNTTINQYIADTRINRAKELMRENQLTLHEISEKIGYTDYNYFSRTFKKKMGIPPSVYNEMYSNQKKA